MFFMMGIMDGRKDIDYNRLITCMACGRYGGIEVYMTYTVLSLFFIPVFKWNRHYYVRTTCCSAIYELDPAIGRKIERGEQVAGFRDMKTGRFGEVSFIRNASDIEAFKKEYGIAGEIRKEY